MRLTHFLKEGKGIKTLSVILIMLNIAIFGHLSGLNKNSPKIVIFSPKMRLVETIVSDKEIDVKPTGDLVASKSGTRIYYIWCSGVSRIKPENRVYFDNLEEALNKGYKPASNCPGM